MTTQTAEALAAATKRWLALRDRCEVLRKECYEFKCEVESRDSRLDPCWKSWEGIWDHFSELSRGRDYLDEEEWCQPCRDRERVRGTRNAAAASRGAALRNVIRIYRTMEGAK